MINLEQVSYVSLHGGLQVVPVCSTFLSLLVFLEKFRTSFFKLPLHFETKTLTLVPLCCRGYSCQYMAIRWQTVKTCTVHLVVDFRLKDFGICRFACKALCTLSLFNGNFKLIVRFFSEQCIFIVLTIVNDTEMLRSVNAV